MLVNLVGHALAVCIGLSLGLIGGGGSVLALPVLMYVMGVETKSAIAMTLAIVGSVSLIGVVSHWRSGNVNLKAAIMFAPPAMVGSYVGAKIATLPIVSATAQLMGFVVMMVTASILMIQRSGKKKSEEPLNAAPTSGIWQRFLLIPLAGLSVGLVTGFVGIGGGFLVIPALVLLVQIPMKQAIGTSLLVIAFQSVTGFWGYLSSQIPINLPLVFSFIVAASMGILLGSHLSQFVPGKQLEKGFGYFLLAIAVLIVVKS
jgi:uncharacterized membrane protein YfcA